MKIPISVKYFGSLTPASKLAKQLRIQEAFPLSDVEEKFRRDQVQAGRPINVWHI